MMKTIAYCDHRICRGYQEFRVVPETITDSHLIYRCGGCNEVRTWDYVRIMQKGSLEARLIKELTR